MAGFVGVETDLAGLGDIERDEMHYIDRKASWNGEYFVPLKSQEDTRSYYPGTQSITSKLCIRRRLCEYPEILKEDFYAVSIVNCKLRDIDIIMIATSDIIVIWF